MNDANLRIWLADLTYTQQTIAADVIPNAIGGIATFTETRLPLSAQIRLFKYPEKLAAALDAGLPDVIGFSNYIWNFHLAYGFAERIKAHRPRTVIVFGGPNYPIVRAEQERFLRAHPAIDFYVVKEGEVAFAELMAALWTADLDVEAVKGAVPPSVHAIAADGTARFAQTTARIGDLTEIPSPYVSGRLDEFFDGMLLPIIQTNRGCPFQCTFCVEGVDYYNKVYRSSQEKVAAEIESIGAKMAALRASGGRNDLFIADSNFGMFKEDLETCRQLARARQRYQWPEYINVATGKNQKARVLEASRLIDGALRLSGSVQSLSPLVLKNIKRDNISATGLMDLALSAATVGANSYSEIILGLPGDSKQAHCDTVRTVMDAGFTNLYLFQLMLLPGTEMCTDESKAQYGLVSRYRVLPRCYGFFDVLGQRTVAAEIEEIAVASDTLSFEDYLDCRKLHLVVTIFYNDSVFGALLKLLRTLKLSVYRWMELMRDAPKPQRLAELFARFERATREELWEDRVQLEAFIQQPGSVDRLIAGELGNNLLFVHKTQAITDHLPELVELARSTMQQVLGDAGQDTPEHLEFVDDALAFHASRASNLFVDRDRPVVARLRYDVKAFESEMNPASVAAFELERPTTFRFVLDDSQRGLIDRYTGIYGSTAVGIGRILSKVYVRKLFRHAVTDGDVVSTESELRYRIAGLQN